LPIFLNPILKEFTTWVWGSFNPLRNPNMISKRIIKSTMT
jgi:hypothetical protein